MASPYDLFIQFLITSGSGEGEVNEALKALALPPLKTRTDFLVHQRHIEDRVPPGILSQIETGRYSVDFMKWMRELGLAEFWEAEPSRARDYPERTTDRKLVYDINSDPGMRLTINALLMKGVEPAAILPMVAGRYPLVIKEKHIVSYKQYFFDPARMTRADWRGFLPGVSDREQRVYFVALTEDLDAVKAELDLPARINTSGILQDLLSRSVRKARHHLQQSSLQSGAEARKWISTVSGLVDKYEKYRKTDSTDFAKSLQMEFEYVETGFPTPDKETLAALNEQKAKQEMEKKDPDAEEEGKNEQ